MDGDELNAGILWSIFYVPSLRDGSVLRSLCFSTLESKRGTASKLRRALLDLEFHESNSVHNAALISYTVHKLMLPIPLSLKHGMYT